MAAIEVDVKIDIGRIARDNFDAIERELKLTMQDAATEIDVRSSSGQDVNGQSFAPYAPSTVKSREKAKRQTGYVDLTMTGRMWVALTSTAKRIGESFQGEIFFSTAEAAQKARFNQERRNFFGLSDEQIAKIRARLVSVLKD